ncbi:hypothetical protein F4777DRAFT_570308 [Nemania sp. FL0916]|nr:hypothetical protein F4777DRAFT_570308 [Nemania sp. FL0916]
MAANGSQDLKDRKAQAPLDEETPEEQQLQRDLEYLGLLLVKCRDIRTTIPRMLIGLPHLAEAHKESAEDLWNEAVNHVKSAGIEIQDFTTLYTSEETKKVLDKAKKSREANPRAIKPWRYEDHPGWADVPR